MFTIVSTIVFLLLFLIWNRDDFQNIVLKFVFALMTGWGAYLIFTNRMFG
jgi:hypothetical protein